MSNSKSNHPSKLFSVSSQAQAHSLHDQTCGRWWLYLSMTWRPSLPNHQFSANDFCYTGALNRSGPRTWSWSFEGSRFHAMFPLDFIVLQTLSLYFSAVRKTSVKLEYSYILQQNRDEERGFFAALRSLLSRLVLKPLGEPFFLCPHQNTINKKTQNVSPTT